MRIISYFTLIALIFICTQCNLKNEGDGKTPKTPLFHYPHYDLVIKIDPDKGFIEINGKLTVSKKYMTEEITFYLDSGLQTHSFMLNKATAFKKDSSRAGMRYMPSASKIYTDEKTKLDNNLNE